MNQTTRRGPGRPPKNLDSQDHTIQNDASVDLSDISLTGDRPEIEPVEGPNAMVRAEELAFMEEKLEIMVMDNPDTNAVPLPRVSVNGRNQFFLRGSPQTVRRKYVEALARGKVTRFKQKNSVDPQTGHIRQEMLPYTALADQFQVIHDPNPKGIDWLRRIISDRR